MSRRKQVLLSVTEAVVFLASELDDLHSIRGGAGCNGGSDRWYPFGFQFANLRFNWVGRCFVSVSGR